MDITRRVGKFSIAHRLIEDEPQVLMSEVMARCVVVRAEAVYAERRVEYTAMSPDFDSVAEGEIIPWYDVEIIGPNARFVRRVA